MGESSAGRGGARPSSSDMGARWRKSWWSVTSLSLVTMRTPYLKTCLVVCSVSTVVKCISSVGNRSEMVVALRGRAESVRGCGGTCRLVTSGCCGLRRLFYPFTTTSTTLALLSVQNPV
uniref:Secreted protein n=1 Tax=Mesocestoides corti TaxID=53468 RepID=A0A5K3F9P0_MESCO